MEGWCTFRERGVVFDGEVVLAMEGWCTFRERGVVFDGEVVWFER